VSQLRNVDDMEASSTVQASKQLTRLELFVFALPNAILSFILIICQQQSLFSWANQLVSTLYCYATSAILLWYWRFIWYRPYSYRFCLLLLHCL